MRCYPTQDVNFYWEQKPSWYIHCPRPDLNWKAPYLQASHTIAIWNDLEGAKMEKIQKKDLYFPNWDSNRRRPEACLPLYYGTGNRFNRLEKASPIDYKCAPMPIDLQSARAVKQIEKKKNLESKKTKSNNKKSKAKSKMKGNK